MNLLIASWIFSTTDSTLLPQVSYKSESKALWNTIKNWFSAGNRPCVHELEKELGNCTQQDAAVVDYFGKLTTICDELANYEKDLNWCYGWQTCTRIVDGERQREQKKLHKFHFGLDNYFRTMIAQILNMNPLILLIMLILWSFRKNGIIWLLVTKIRE